MTDRPRPITVTEYVAGGFGPSSVSLPCRQACVNMPYWAASSLPARGQLRFDELGEGQIHVVAAEQQMIADRLANEGELALLLRRPGSG